MKELIKVIDEVYGNHVYDIIDTDKVDDVEAAAAALAYNNLYLGLEYSRNMSEDEFDDNWDFSLYLLEDTEKTVEELRLLLMQIGAVNFLIEYGV